MGYIRHLLEVIKSIPETIVPHSVYVKKNGEVQIDIDNETRVQINPHADWAEDDSNKLSYIENKPEFGTAALHDISDEISDEIDISQDVPTVSATYNALREIQALVETTKSLVGSSLVAEGRADMTRTDHPYVYVGDEDGMQSGYVYFYDERQNDWIPIKPYNSQGLVTDKTLLIENQAADAKATGDAINKVKSDFQKELVERDVFCLFDIDENGHLIQTVQREYGDTSFELQEGRLIVTYG